MYACGGANGGARGGSALRCRGWLAGLAGLAGLLCFQPKLRRPSQQRARWLQKAPRKRLPNTLSDSDNELESLLIASIWHRFGASPLVVQGFAFEKQNLLIFYDQNGPGEPDVLFFYAQNEHGVLKTLIFYSQNEHGVLETSLFYDRNENGEPDVCIFYNQKLIWA